MSFAAPRLTFSFNPINEPMNFFRSFFSTRPVSPGTMADASKKIQEIINDHNVVVFSKSYCPYCRQTKQVLSSLDAEFETVELDQISDGSALQDALKELTNQRTVPNIFISKKSIGGNSDLQSLSSAGKLKGLLKEAGALTASQL
ncbi:hypothetical protein G7046_g497 [Stylonectria norvegica]|nr:hypothetical protein G7046_g497 [Stylonectria norvegica]